MQSTNPTTNIRNCARCRGPYDWRRSTSRSLKMTYCNSLCEHAELGFTIEALLSLEPAAGATQGAVQPRLTPAPVAGVGAAA